MNTPRPLLAALTSAFASLLFASAALAQGALTPPGAPAPMFKTLDQIEARKPLGTPNVATTSTIVISEPGSYVLVGPITVASGNGITINANNVSLDLNGFTISSTANLAGAGIVIAGESGNVANIAIHNGSIQGAYTVASAGTGTGTGFYSGIVCFSTNTKNISVSGILIRGVGAEGILLYDSINNHVGKISNSTCSDVGHGGFTAAIVENCIVTSVSRTAFSTGINARNVSNCNVNAETAESGIVAQTVVNSSSTAEFEGITANAVSHCYGVALSSVAVGCVGISANTVANSRGYGRVGIYSDMAVTHSVGGSSAGPGTRTGINCPNGTVSFSQGTAPLGASNRSIVAKIAVACTANNADAPIQSPSLQLGTVGIAP